MTVPADAVPSSFKKGETNRKTAGLANILELY